MTSLSQLAFMMGVCKNGDDKLFDIDILRKNEYCYFMKILKDRYGVSFEDFYMAMCEALEYKNTLHNKTEEENATNYKKLAKYLCDQDSCVSTKVS